MGFMDWLSPGLTAATQGATGWMAGRQAAQQRDQTNAMTMLELMRQQRQDQEQKAYRDAQIEDIRQQGVLRQSQQRLAESRAAAEQATTDRQLNAERNSFDILKRQNMLPPGTTDEARDLPGWQKYLGEMMTAKTAADTQAAIAKRDRELHLADNQNKLDIARIMAGKGPDYTPVPQETDEKGNAIFRDKQGTPYTIGPTGWIPAQHVIPKQGGTMGGSLSLTPQDRAKMLAQAKLDNATMKAYEDKIRGKGLGWIASAAAGASQDDTKKGAIGNVERRLGNTVLGQSWLGGDPEYQKYLTAQSSYGRIMGNLQSKRYTENQAKIEKDISGLTGGDLDSTVAYKQQLREASLNDPDTINGTTTTTTATTPGRNPFR